MEMPDSIRDYGRDKLRQAVQLMRDACDTAERAINRTDHTELEAAISVLHTFTWMWANAASDVETCIANVDRVMQIPAKETTHAL